MPVPVSNAFLTTLASSVQRRVSTAEVWNGNTKLAELGNVTDGQVDIDVSQQVRRTCTCTVNSQGLELDDLVPENADSLLHPASGNELRLFRGFQYADGSQELCGLGVFRMTKPDVTDTGDSITIAVTGNDRSSLVTRRCWTDVYAIGAGALITDAVEALLDDRIGDLGPVFKLAVANGVTVPATTFGTDLAGANDPMADGTSLATAASMELFFDYEGAVVMQPVPTPTSASVPSFGNQIYVEGDNCTFGQVGRTLDETQTYNGVIVLGTGTGGAPVRAEVWDTDPTSPTYIGGPWGKTPYIYQTSLIPAPGSNAGSAVAQATSMAQALYQKVHTILDTPNFTAVPNPALLESDILTLGRGRIGVNANYTVATITIPLDVASTMAVTCRPLPAAA